jgi:hypothetical protein
MKKHILGQRLENAKLKFRLEILDIGFILEVLLKQILNGNLNLG